VQTFTTIHELREALGGARREGHSIGFVPTMGALHQGHVSLIERARADNDRVVVSIFVNPLQFGPAEDFNSYPRDPGGDAAKVEQAGAHYLFAPVDGEIYPRGAVETRVEPGRIGDLVEGKARPGFFTGVATVCVKLFNIVGPARVYFGEKDAQQLAVIKQVVADLGLPVEVVACPTVRESDGLAMSSRNAYLDGEQRRAAAILSKALLEAADRVATGERRAEKVARFVEDAVASEPAMNLEYVHVVDPDTFELLEEIEGPATVVLAAKIGGTHLIDNVKVALQEGGSGGVAAPRGSDSARQGLRSPRDNLEEE
jgi:pantoate--beta-alanine ligase